MVERDEQLQADRILAAFMVVSALAADLCLTAEAVEDLANRLARAQSESEGGRGTMSLDPTVASLVDARRLGGTGRGVVSRSRGGRP